MGEGRGRWSQVWPLVTHTLMKSMRRRGWSRNRPTPPPHTASDGEGCVIANVHVHHFLGLGPLFWGDLGSSCADFFGFFIITTKKKGERTYYDEEFFMLSRGPRGLLLEMSVNVGRSQYALRSKVPGENCRLSLWRRYSSQHSFSLVILLFLRERWKFWFTPRRWTFPSHPHLNTPWKFGN